MEREADADLLGDRQHGLEEDAVVVPHPIAPDRLLERLLRGQLVAGQRIPFAHPRGVEGGDPGAAAALRVQVGAPHVGRQEVVAEDGDPGGGHVADRGAVVGQLLLATGQPAQDLVPVRVRDVLEALHDQPVRLAALAQADQLIDRPVAVGARQVARGVELDAGQAELPGEGRDGLVEPLEMPECEADRHRAQAPRGCAPRAGRTSRAPYHTTRSR